MEGLAFRAVHADRTVSTFSVVRRADLFCIPYIYLSQNVTFGHKHICMILRMNQNRMRRLLLIRVTEIVEVTETITIVIENNVLKAEQDSDCVSVIVTGILTDAPESNWIQPELNALTLNSSAPDVAIKKMDKEESPSSPKSS